MSNNRSDQMNDYSKCPCSGINPDRHLKPNILLLLAPADMTGYSIIRLPADEKRLMKGRLGTLIEHKKAIGRPIGDIEEMFDPLYKRNANA
jgi:hypothetical protein